ncbi:hypothetical protein J6Z19_03550 [bacterium]|nr:hypothetical protein [bacterium]
MKKKFLIAFFVLLACFGLSALTPAFPAVQFLVADDDEDEDEEESSSNEETAEDETFESSRNSEDEEEIEEKSEPEEDPFAKSGSKPKKKKDDFATEESDSEEDDFVVEKREKGVVHHHKEPDLGKVVVSTYLYTEASVRSKKLFELYKNDDLVILEEVNDFYKVEFLGKSGWVPRNDVILEKWYTYRISLELSGGIAGGAGDFKGIDIFGNYTLKLNVSIIQDFIVGIEGRMLSFDRDNLYYGGGLMLRYYIHGLRTKKTRSAVSASAGFLGGIERIEDNTQQNNSLYRFFGGPYASVSLDYFFRVWEYIAIGIGGDFNYLKVYGSFRGMDKTEQLFQGGGHLTLMFNVMR